MLPDGWQRSSSSAVEAYRYDPDAEILELIFVDGDAVYAYPCDPHLYVEFLAAPSQGRFVNEVLKPHAERLGRTPRPRSL
jgi:KTSC domain